jgi:hypothetical protein
LLTAQLAADRSDRAARSIDRIQRVRRPPVRLHDKGLRLAVEISTMAGPATGSTLS